MATKRERSETRERARASGRQAPAPPRHRAAGNAGSESSSRWFTGTSLAIAGILAVAAGTWWASACKSTKPAPPDKGPKPAHVETVPPGVKPVLPVASDDDTEPGEAAEEIADAAVPDGPWQGPFVVARVLTAPVYSTMSRSSDKLIGYMRSGGKAPADGAPIVKPNCKEGWYRLVPRGFVCGKHAVAATDEAVAAAETPPDFDAIVPYKYAYNAKDGTPLYREIPTREQMEQYEPYLTAGRARAETGTDSGKAGSSKERRAHGDHDASDADARETTGDAGRSHASLADAGVEAGRARPSDALDAGVPSSVADGGADEAEPDLPWWQIAPDAGRKTITLQDMAEGADGVLVKRMARGFFVAVDKTFRRNDRLWIRTTEGLYAPSDRMSINSPPTFHGVEVGAGGMELPVAFVMSEQASTYELKQDDELKKSKTKVKRFTAIALTGKTMERGGATYRETKDGYWVQDRSVTIVETASPPAGLGEREKWIDVNLTHQTLVAYEGTRPVYATLVSSGKKGRTKATDHSTIEGEFRIREKHVAATMDGDGAAPGEGPYSIQDVPYVMYFKGSYAIHGAFWHNNFGRKMSHGCVNLAPQDARRVFQWTEPQVPQGWHGAWATDDHPGTRIVLHE